MEAASTYKDCGWADYRKQGEGKQLKYRLDHPQGKLRNKTSLLYCGRMQYRDHHDETKWDWCRLKDCMDEEAQFGEPSWWEHGCLSFDLGVRRREAPMTT